MPKHKQADQPRKMSEIVKEMLEQLLRDPEGVPSSEALHVALFLANIAWNECVGVGGEREGNRSVWETVAARKPDLWDELKSNDASAMVDELVEYKKAHFPDDRRRIVTCGGTTRGTIRVEWIEPAPPGVDAKWGVQLYGMVRSGMEKEAVRFLQETRKMSREEAMVQVMKIRTQMGM